MADKIDVSLSSEKRVRCAHILLIVSFLDMGVGADWGDLRVALRRNRLRLQPLLEFGGTHLSGAFVENEEP